MQQDGLLLGQIEQRLRQIDVPLSITLWNGQRLAAAEHPAVSVTVRSPQVLAALASPSMGKLARHYVEEQLDIEGEPRTILRLGEALAGSPSGGGGASSRLRRWIGHTRSFDRESIRHHYDVSDEFFGLWLDRRRVYSCAYFCTEADSLEDAQAQKLDHICRKLMLRPGERLLDIGCGWGALVMWAAERYGARATGITLSENQHRYAQARIREAGLESVCEVRLLDYRDVPEDQPYDKVASVGMFEHVGRKNLPAYFEKIHRLLKPGGLVMNHGITLNGIDQAELGSDIGGFIDEYVFPGGELTHIARVVEEMARQGLETWDLESLRPHYARTLWHWVGRLEAARTAALEYVTEKNYRVWRIYMAGSAHAFERGWLSVYQVLAGRPTADGKLAVPLTRDSIYAPAR
jgi:cyclopropane-fatty-acyl-phospholipid synthase